MEHRHWQRESASKARLGTLFDERQCTLGPSSSISSETLEAVASEISTAEGHVPEAEPATSVVSGKGRGGSSDGDKSVESPREDRAPRDESRVVATDSAMEQDLEVESVKPTHPSGEGSNRQRRGGRNPVSCSRGRRGEAVAEGKPSKGLAPTGTMGRHRTQDLFRTHTSRERQTTGRISSETHSQPAAAFRPAGSLPSGRFP